MKIRFCNTFLMLLAILGTIHLHAQVSAYPFTQLTTTYTPITGGQVLGTATNDDISFVEIFKNVSLALFNFSFLGYGICKIKI